MRHSAILLLLGSALSSCSWSSKPIAPDRIKKQGETTESTTDLDEQPLEPIAPDPVVEDRPTYFDPIQPEPMSSESRGIYSAALSAVAQSTLANEFSDSQGNDWGSTGISLDLSANAAGSVGLLMINGTASARINIGLVDQQVQTKNRAHKPAIIFNESTTEAEVMQQVMAIADIGQKTGLLLAPDIFIDAIAAKGLEFMNMMQSVQGNLQGGWGVDELTLSLGVDAEGLILVSETFSGVKVSNAMFLDFVFQSQEFFPDLESPSKETASQNSEMSQLQSFVESIAGNLNQIEEAVTLPNKAMGVVSIEINAGMDAQGNFGMIRYATSSALTIKLGKGQDGSMVFHQAKIKPGPIPLIDETVGPASYQSQAKSVMSPDAFQKSLVKAVESSQKFLPDTSINMQVAGFGLSSVEVLFEVTTTAALSVATINSQAAIAIEFN